MGFCGFGFRCSIGFVCSLLVVEMVLSFWCIGSFVYFGFGGCVFCCFCFFFFSWPVGWGFR